MLEDRLIPAARSLKTWILPATVLAFCLASFGTLFIRTAFRVNGLGQAGYGDAGVMHAVQRLQRTGIIYHDTSCDLPAFYGPMLYAVFALPGRFVTVANPLLLPRLIVFGAFLLCIATVVSIARKLIPHPTWWLWSLPLALSFSAMVEWVLQLRGDFLAVLCALLALRLLLSDSSRAVLAAGACAGFATQFKFTYVAALGAGFLWLLARRRWKDLAAFSVAGALTSIGLYAAFMAREPKLVENIFGLGKPIMDYAGAAAIVFHILQEPIALLGLTAICFLRWRPIGGWGLLVIFLALSFSVASIIALQAGGNMNYYFEFLFGLVPLAALGMMTVRRSPFTMAGLYLSALLLIFHVIPKAHKVVEFTRLPKLDAAHNRNLIALKAALRDRKVLSMDGDISLAASQILLDPFGASQFERMGRLDLRPLAARIRGRDFDLVAVQEEAETYRGIPLLSPTLRNAIEQTYRPYCAMDGAVLLLARGSPAGSELAARLAALGCNVSACDSGSACRSW
jgi:hypothetical protein